MMSNREADGLYLERYCSVTSATFTLVSPHPSRNTLEKFTRITYKENMSYMLNVNGFDSIDFLVNNHVPT